MRSTRVTMEGGASSFSLTGADDARLPSFIKQYEQGPQTPEREAECTGGTGRPIQG